MPKYEVVVTRIDYADRVIEVDADNPKDAEMRAREVAGDHLFDHPGHTEEYEIGDVRPKRMNVMVAPVLVALPADIPPEGAKDAISAIFTDVLEVDGAILDWSYIPGPNGGFYDPVEVEVSGDYTEGEFIGRVTDRFMDALFPGDLTSKNKYLRARMLLERAAEEIIGRGVDTDHPDSFVLDTIQTALDAVARRFRVTSTR